MLSPAVRFFYAGAMTLQTRCGRRSGSADDPDRPRTTYARSFFVSFDVNRSVSSSRGDGSSGLTVPRIAVGERRPCEWPGRCSPADRNCITKDTYDAAIYADLCVAEGSRRRRGACDRYSRECVLEENGHGGSESPRLERGPWRA